MSIKLMSQVWDDKDLRGPALILMLAMADWASDDGIAFPRVPAITAKTRMGKSQVYEKAAELEALGYLKRLGDGRWQVLLRSPEIRKPIPETRKELSGNPENPQTPIKEEPSLNRQSPLPKGKARNVVWDALALATAAPQTKSETSDFAKTVKELTQTGATPEQVADFAPWWMLTFPGASLTHRCYRLHWAAFLVSLTPASSRAANYLS